MNLKECLTICKSFDHTLIDGKYRCRYLAGDVCDIDGNGCRIVRFLRGKQPHVSVSQLGTFTSCPQKYNLRYNLGMKPETTPAWAYMGKEFHRIKGLIDDGKPWELAPIDGVSIKEHQIILLDATLRWYADHRTEFVKPAYTEVFFAKALDNGIEMQGYLDGWTPGEHIIDEYKYSTDDYDTLDVRAQACAYLWAKPDARAFRLTRFAKLSIKPARTGSFHAKVAEALDNMEPGEVGSTWTWARASLPIADEMNRMQEITRLIAQCKTSNIWPCNYRNCKGYVNCDYRIWCKTH